METLKLMDELVIRYGFFGLFLFLVSISIVVYLKYLRKRVFVLQNPHELSLEDLRKYIKREVKTQMDRHSVSGSGEKLSWTEWYKDCINRKQMCSMEFNEIKSSVMELKAAVEKNDDQIRSLLETIHKNEKAFMEKLHKIDNQLTSVLTLIKRNNGSR